MNESHVTGSESDKNEQIQEKSGQDFFQDKTVSQKMQNGHLYNDNYSPCKGAGSLLVTNIQTVAFISTNT